ncbi:MAG: NYN domain-containing protein [Candidatus Azambacteria bacterium]|nr:NYN domain-containing protein [Candidatus Azambacteria bacterium]
MPQGRIGAIFVDWDNLVIPAKMDRSFDSSEINIHLMHALLEASLKFVDKAHIFIFTSEGNLIRNSFYLAVDTEDFEIELITVPTIKDAADEEIRKKAEEFAVSSPEISTFIFASGDGYFLRTIVKLITDFRKKVVLMPYCKDGMHHLYRRVNDRTDKFSITFLKPHFCKSG